MTLSGLAPLSISSRERTSAAWLPQSAPPQSVERKGPGSIPVAARSMDWCLRLAKPGAGWLPHRGTTVVAPRTARRCRSPPVNEEEPCLRQLKW